MNDSQAVADVELKEQLIEEVFNALVKNPMMTLRELKGLTDAEMEAMYAVGYNFAQSGRLEDARKVFNGLLVLDHAEKKYWYAVAAVLQKLGQYKEALMGYQVCAFLDDTNPKPQYHCAECHLALGDAELAANALEMMDELAEKSSETGRAYQEKAALLRARIEKGTKG